MEQQMNYFVKARELMKSSLALNEAVETCGMEKSLLHLVKPRASQVNGCTFCVDVHELQAPEDGDSVQRVLLVAAWRESTQFIEHVRVAFAWTEAVIRVADAGVPDALYAQALTQFSESELVKLTVAASLINTWNLPSEAFHALYPIRGRISGNILPLSGNGAGRGCIQWAEPTERSA